MPGKGRGFGGAEESRSKRAEAEAKIFVQQSVEEWQAAVKQVRGAAVIVAHVAIQQK